MSEAIDVDVFRYGWTAAADATLAALWHAGYGSNYIGEQLHCSRQCVWTRRQRLKLFTRGKGGRRDHLPQSGVERVCLCCRRGFRSTWIGNRLCLDCKQAA